MSALYDVSRCPCGFRCEACGDAHQAVAVHPRPTALGVICLTMCPACAASPVDPPITVGTARRFHEQHRRHVGEL